MSQVPRGNQSNSVAGEVRPHNQECRKRFSELYPREKAQAVEGDAQGVSEATTSGAGDTAQEADLEQGSGGTDPSQSRKELKKLFADKAKERRQAQGQQEEPKRLRQTQKGAKRPAETTLEEAASEAQGHEEVIGGLPTLHEEALLAAYPDDGLLDTQGAFDERTGEALPVDKVRKARGRELDKMLEHNVKEDITWMRPSAEDLK